MAVVRALAVRKVEGVGKPLLGVVLGADIFFLVWTIRASTLAGVVNPADEVILVRLLAFASQIRGESSPFHLIAFTDGVAGEAPASLQQLLAVIGVAGVLLR